MTTAQQLEEMAQTFLSCNGGEYEAVGIRVQVGKEMTCKIGSTLRASSVWDDGVRTSQKLPGTAAFFLEDSCRANDYSTVLREAMSYQVTSRVVLIGTKSETVTCDMPERFAEIFPQAIVLAIL